MWELGVDPVPVPIPAPPTLMSIRPATHSSPVETLRRVLVLAAFHDRAGAVQLMVDRPYHDRVVNCHHSIWQGECRKVKGEASVTVPLGAVQHPFLYIGL